MLARKPELTDLPMNAPQAEQQIVSGIYQLESGQWRWMSQSATILLKPPSQPEPLWVRFAIPDAAPARQVSVELDEHPVASQTYSGPGSYTLTTPLQQPNGDTVTVTIRIDKSFSVQGDNRKLGIILTSVGFMNP